jgi:hypothetical protein
LYKYVDGWFKVLVNSIEELYRSVIGKP